MIYVCPCISIKGPYDGTTFQCPPERYFFLTSPLFPPFFPWKARDLEEAQVAKQVQHPLAVPPGPGRGISIFLQPTQTQQLLLLDFKW